MKAYELIHGNYLKLIRNGEIIRVSTITKHKVGYHYVENETYINYALLHEVEPIRIHDIKEKEVFALYGFKQVDREAFKTLANDRVYSYEGDDVSLQIIADDAHYYYVFNGYDTHTGLRISKRFTYMHELQKLMVEFGYCQKINFEECTAALTMG